MNVEILGLWVLCLGIKARSLFGRLGITISFKWILAFQPKQNKRTISSVTFRSDARLDAHGTK